MQTVDIKSKTGIYRGIANNDENATFLGIHYAQKPERWKIAQPLPASSELHEAFECGEACPQQYLPNEWPNRPSKIGEDCLWLNIWNGKTRRKDCPVMVWIHGGSFAGGSARFEFFNGGYGDLSRLAEENPDIVFVSINYRLNLLGSIDLREFEGGEDYPDSNDLELHDMIAALKWINENISDFGGDPKNITIMGQSAGAWATLALCVIPTAASLFNKAIVSSSGFSEFVDFKDDARALFGSRKVKELFNVSTVRELLSIPAEELCAKTYDLLFAGVKYEPLANGRLFPVHPNKAWESGVASHIILLAGSLAGDLDTMIYGWPDEQIRATAPMLLGRGPEMGAAAIEKYINNYPSRDEMTAYKDALTDISIRMRIINNVELHIKSGGKAYVWFCDYMAKNGIMRTQHLFDTLCVFNTLDISCSMGPNIPEPIETFDPPYELGDRMRKVWMNFVRTGNPNCDATGVEWLEYDIKHKYTMHINNNWQLLDGGVRPLDTDVALAMHTEAGIV